MTAGDSGTGSWNPRDEAEDEIWDRRWDAGYGLEYAPTDDTPPNLPGDREPVDDVLGDPAEEAFESAWRAGLIDRENYDKSWRRT